MNLIVAKRHRNYYLFVIIHYRNCSVALVGDAFPRKRMRPCPLLFGSLSLIAGRYPGKPGKTAPTVQASGFPATGSD